MAPFVSLLKNFFKDDYNKKTPKSYSCDDCGKSFASNRNLQQHNDGVHLGLKKFSCDRDQCDFTCSQKQNLLHHIRCVHEKLKLHTCQECSATFLSKAHLQEHENSVHDGIKYKCEVCNKFISTKSHLRRHMRDMHDE